MLIDPFLFGLFLNHWHLENLEPFCLLKFKCQIKNFEYTSLAKQSRLRWKNHRIHDLRCQEFTKCCCAQQHYFWYPFSGKHNKRLSYFTSWNRSRKRMSKFQLLYEYEPSVLLRNYCLFRKARFQCPLFHSQYPLFYLQCPLFLHSKVHLYEDFDYEAHFSRSKVDFWETLPDTLLFRECLLVDSYGIIYSINSPWYSNYTRVTDHFQSVTLFFDDHRIPYFLGSKKSCYRFYTDNRILISLFYFSFIFPSIRIISFWDCALVTFA